MQRAEAVPTLQVQIYLSTNLDLNLVQLWTSSNLSKNSEGRLWTNEVLFACVQTEDGQCKHRIMHSVNWKKFRNVLVPMLDLICTTRRSQSKHIGSIVYHLITQVEELSPHCALFSEDKQSMQEHTAFQHLPFPSSQARTARNPSCTLDSLKSPASFLREMNHHQTVTEKALVTSQTISPLPIYSEE